MTSRLLSAVATAALLGSMAAANAQTDSTKSKEMPAPQAQEQGRTGPGSAQRREDQGLQRNVDPAPSSPATRAQRPDGVKSTTPMQTQGEDGGRGDRSTAAPADETRSGARRRDGRDMERDVERRDAPRQTSDPSRMRDDRARTERGQREDRARTRDRDRERVMEREREDRARAEDRDREDFMERRGERQRATDRTRDRQRDSVSLSSREETTIRDAIARQDVRQEAEVNFSVSVGTRVPPSVRLHRLSDEIVSIVPRYRNHRYVLVEDEIVIVHPRTFRIVAVLPADGRSQARVRNRGRIEFSSAQRDRIRTYALQECRTVIEAPEFDLDVGSRVPSSYELCPFDDVVAEDVRIVQPYRYLIVEDEVVLVDPSTNTIVEVIR